MALSYINNKEIKFGSSKPLNGVYTPGSPTREYEPLDSLGIYLNSGIPLSYGVENGRYMSMSDEFVATSQGNSYSFNQFFAAQMMLGFKLHDRFIACDTEHKITGAEPLLRRAYLAEITEKTLDYFKIKIYGDKTRTFCIRMSASEVPTSYVDLTNSFDESGLNLTQTDRRSFLSYYRFYPLTARDPGSRAEETLGVDYYLLPSAEGLGELSGDILSKFNAFISSEGHALTSLGNTAFAYAGDINYVLNYKGETSEAAVSAAKKAEVILGQVEEMHADINQILPEMKENLELTKQYRDEAMSTEIGTVREDLNQLKGDLAQLENPVEWIDGYYVGGNGDVIQNVNYKVTDYIKLVTNGLFIPFYYDIKNFKNTKIAIYDENKNYLYQITTSTSESLEVVRGYIEYNSNYPQSYYAKVCSYKDYDGKVSLPNVSKILIKELPSYVEIEGNSIVDKTISIDKCDFFLHDEETNFIKDWNQNCLLYDGKLKDGYTGYFVTDYIPITAINNYYVGNLFSGYYAFYSDPNDNSIIEYHNNDYSLTNPLTIPSGANYVRLQAINENDKNNAWVSLNNDKPKPYGYKLSNVILTEQSQGSYCDYKGDEFSAFTKCLCIGDSLTSGVFNYKENGTTKYTGIEKYSFPTYLKKITGVDTTNLGLSSHTSAEWYDRKKDEDLSGYDIAIIQLGVNDAIRYNDFGDTSKTAFTNIINKLKSENPNIKIFVANIIPAISYSYDIYKEVSDKILAWVTSTYANDDSVIPLDMQKYGHTKDSEAYNCGHLSAYGYFVLAKDYKAYISWYMSKNPNVFRQIQFIGTEYIYTD